MAPKRLAKMASIKQTERLNQSPQLHPVSALEDGGILVVQGNPRDWLHPYVLTRSGDLETVHSYYQKDVVINNVIRQGVYSE